MNKQFDVIPIEDYGVVVDKEAKISKGDRFTEKYSVNIVRICQEDSLYNKIADGLYTYDTQFCSKVIATINKRIDDIPLIELKKTVNQLADEYAIEKTSHGPTVHSKWSLEIGFIEGYKAAQKKYSEEDMKKAHFHGWFQRERYPPSPDKCGYEGKFPSEWGKMDYEEHEDWFAEQFLKSLQPKLPKSVVLEMEVDADDERNWYVDCPSGKYWEDEPIPPSKDRLYSNARYLKVKITNPSTNTIIPISYD